MQAKWNHKICALLNYKPLLWREHFLRHQALTAMKKVALVTGANKGLDLEIARQLAQGGITAIIAARDEVTLMSKGQGGEFAKPGYTTSKAALNVLTVITAQELKDTKVKVNAPHPGWVQTDP